MVTIKDVAKEAGVSISSVSAVVNNKSIISDKMRENVEKAINKLGYTQNTMASSLKKGSSPLIAVVVPSITSAFFPEVMKGVEKAASEHGLTVCVFSSNRSLSEEKERLVMLKGHFIKGVILNTLANLEKETEYVKFLEEKYVQEGIPIILLESTINSSDILSVSVNNYECSYHLVETLIRAGHHDISHISSNRGLSFSDDRTRAYRDALVANGITVDEARIKAGDYSPMSGYEVMRELLQEGKEGTALFSSNDQMLLGAVKALKECSYKIPADIAVAGFDNIHISTLVEPPLTTVNVPRYKMGYSAVELLVKKCVNLATQSVVLKAELIERESSNANVTTTWDLYGW